MEGNEEAAKRLLSGSLKAGGNLNGCRQRAGPQHESLQHLLQEASHAMPSNTEGDARFSSFSIQLHTAGWHCGAAPKRRGLPQAVRIWRSTWRYDFLDSGPGSIARRHARHQPPGPVTQTLSELLTEP